MAEGPSDDPASRLIQLVRSGRSFSGRERNCVFLNTHAPRFANVSAVSGLDFPDDARAVGRVDWDRDGDLDLWTSNRNAPQCRFLRNDLPASRNWVALRLEGRVSNRDAIGARVTVIDSTPSQRPIVRCLRAGDGYQTQSSKWMHIGLGESPDSSTRCTVEVRWPTGEISTFDGLEVNHRYHLTEGVAIAERVETARHAALEAATLRLPEPTGSLELLSMVRPFLPRLEYLTDQDTPRNVIDFRGTPILVVLWASWCQPCLSELAELTRHQQELDAAGVRVLALSVDRLSLDSGADLERDRELLHELAYPFDAGSATEPLVDKLQLINNYLFGLQKPFPVPTSFLIDKDYRLAAIYRGPIDMQRLRQDIANLGVKDRERRPLTVPFSGRWAEDPTTLPMAVLVLELINAGFVQDASELVQRTQGVYDRATILDLVVRLGMAHYEQDRPKAAELHFQMARKIEPKTVGPEINLGQWHERRAEYALAKRQYSAALVVNSNSLPALNNMAWLLATCPEDSIRDGDQAIELASTAVRLTGAKHPGLLDTLAASLAEVGRYADAERVAARAANRARAASQFNLAGEIERRIEMFRNDQPYRMPRPKP